MKINEVEKLVGISKANIRYYEKEGLLKAARLETNNYRDYTEEDVKTLERIKTLRLLDISLAEIAKLEKNEITLEEIIEEHKRALEEKEKSLRLIKETFDTILASNIDYNQIDDTILAKSQYYWKDKLKVIIKEDITKVEISKDDLNKTIGLLVICGLAINVLIAFIAGNWLLNYSSTGAAVRGIDVGAGFGVCLGVGIVSYFLVQSTSNITVLSADYLINVLALSPFIATAYTIIRGMTSFDEVNTTYSNIHLALTMAFVLLYVIILYVMSQSNKEFFSSIKNLLLVSVMLIIPVVVFMLLVMHMTILPIVLFVLLVLYMGFNWFFIINDQRKYSWYYAIRESIRTMNIAGVIFNMWGRQVAPIRVEKR